MAVPKLEVFQIFLNHNKLGAKKTFKEFFLETQYRSNEDKPKVNSVIFLDHFTNFLKEIDKNDFIINEKKKKALTAYNTKKTDENSDPSITPHGEKFIIEGRIEGGKYGKKRNTAHKGNKAEKSQMGSDTVVMHEFYFFLYTPLNSNQGFLMMHSYTDESISDIFVSFLEKFFTFNPTYLKPKIERFFPKVIKEEFAKASVISKFNFSSQIYESSYSNSSISLKEEAYEVKIEIIPKKPVERKDLESKFAKITKMGFLGPAATKLLGEFPKAKLYLKNKDTKKETPFEIEKEMEIKPVIYLEGRVKVDELDTPDFADLKNYCFKLLQNIQKESGGLNEIREH